MGVETLTRTIPEVITLLDTQISTKLKPPQNSFDVLNRYFTSRQKGSSDSSEYLKGAVGQTLNPIGLLERGDLDSLTGDEVLTASLLGRTIIKPFVKKQPTYLVLDENNPEGYLTNTTGNRVIKQLFNRCETSVVEEAIITPDSSVSTGNQTVNPGKMSNQSKLTYAPDGSNRKVSNSGCADIEGPTRTSDSPLRTWDTFCWEPVDQESANVLVSQNAHVPSDTKITRVKVKHLSSEQIRVGARSCFTLLPNQPFSFSFQPAGTFVSEFAELVKSDRFRSFGDWTRFYPLKSREHLALEISWDRYKMVFHSDSNNPLTFWFRNENGEWNMLNISNVTALSSAYDGGQDFKVIYVYPMGDRIAIGVGAVGDFEPQSDNLAFVQFNKNVLIPETKVEMHIYGGYGDFAFYPIIHPGNDGKAMIVSPPIPVDFEPDPAFLKIEFQGKTGVGRPEPIQGVDKRLHCITFPQPESQNQNVDLGRSLTEHLGDFVEIKYQLFEKEDISLPTSDVCQSLGEPAEREPLYFEINAAHFDAVAQGFTDFAQLNPAQIPKHEYKWALQLIAKPTELAQRVFSPVLDNVQFMALPPDEILNLNPNPQIDPFDVRKLQVTEQAQGTSATFTLNNRLPVNCVDFGEEAGGKQLEIPEAGIYTFDFCRPLDSNFTGIKPVTIRAGIKEGDPSDGGKRDDDNPLHASGGVHVNNNMIAYKQGGIKRMITKKGAKGTRKVDFVEERTKFESPTFGFLGEQPVRFKGFVVHRGYERPDTAQSDVVCTCEDASRRAKDQISMNLPIFDGWCNLAVIYYLGRMAGYTDEELLIFQNQRDPTDVVMIRTLLEEGGSDPDTFSGGCFDGHVDGIPTDSPALDGIGLSYPAFLTHALMPLNTFREQPNYMFQAGQNYWDCMEAIREFTGFYLYANALGSIMYQPNEIALKIKNPYVNSPQATQESETGRTAPPEDFVNDRDPEDRIQFFEKSRNQSGQFDPLAYSQYQRVLNVTVNTADTRNALHFQGLIPVESMAGEDYRFVTKWTPHVINIIPTKEDFEDRIDDPSFAPWIKMGVIKNPHWNDPTVNAYLAQQYFNRLTRPYVTVSFGAWGQPGIYAYEVLLMNEEFMNETGIDQCLIVVTEVSHNFDADSKAFATNITGEMIRLDNFDFSPFVYTNPGFVHGSSPKTAPPSPMPLPGFAGIPPRR